MTLQIQLKRSSVKDSAPTAAQLKDGELGLNYNKDSLALYAKDSDGVIRKIAGGGSEGQYWQLSGTTLSPVDNTYGINIGGGNIELKASDGSAEFSGPIVATDGTQFAKVWNTGYIQSERSSGSFINFEGRLNGSQTSQIRADGSATFGGQVESQSGGFKFPDGTVQTSAAGGPGNANTLQEVTDAGNFTT